MKYIYLVLILFLSGCTKEILEEKKCISIVNTINEPVSDVLVMRIGLHAKADSRGSLPDGGLCMKTLGYTGKKGNICIDKYHNKTSFFLEIFPDECTGITYNFTKDNFDMQRYSFDSLPKIITLSGSKPNE